MPAQAPGAGAANRLAGKLDRVQSARRQPRRPPQAKPTPGGPAVDPRGMGVAEAAMRGAQGPPSGMSAPPAEIAKRLRGNAQMAQANGYPGQLESTTGGGLQGAPPNPQDMMERLPSAPPQGLDPRFQQMVESGRMDPMQAAARNARAQAGMLPFQQQGAPSPGGFPAPPPGDMAQAMRMPPRRRPPVGMQPQIPDDLQQLGQQLPPGAMTKPMFQPGPGLQMPQGGPQMFSQLYGGQGLDRFYS